MADEMWDALRRARGGAYTVGLSINGGQVVPGNVKRAVLILCPVKDQAVYVGFRKAAVKGEGFVLHPFLPPYRMTREDHGELVDGPIFAIPEFSACRFTFLETLLP